MNSVDLSRISKLQEAAADCVTEKWIKGQIPQGEHLFLVSVAIQVNVLPEHEHGGGDLGVEFLGTTITFT